MPNKKEEETTDTSKTNDADKPKKYEPICLTVKREHCQKPHSIELRRNGTKIVVEARIEDHAHSETIGAKTVEQILAENGAAVPANNKDELVITFSPLNGEVVSIIPKTKDEPA